LKKNSRKAKQKFRFLTDFRPVGESQQDPTGRRILPEPDWFHLWFMLKKDVSIKLYAKNKKT